MKDSIPYILAALACIALGYLIRLQVAKPPIPVKPDTVYIKGQDIIKTDTVKIYKTIIKPAITKNDTAKTTFIVDNDSVKSNTEISFAFIDSTFEISQTIDCIAKTIERIDTMKVTLVETKELPVPEKKFYETSIFAFISGIVVTVLIEVIAVVTTL